MNIQKRKTYETENQLVVARDQREALDNEEELLKVYVFLFSYFLFFCFLVMKEFRTR